MSLGPEIASEPDINIGRKQVRAHDGKFYMEADEFYSEVGVFVSLASATSHVIYTVPTGKKFHLRSVVVNGGATPTTVTLYSSAVTATTAKLRAHVQSYGTGYDTWKAENLKGFCFTGYVRAVVSSASTGAAISVGGILDSQPDV